MFRGKTKPMQVFKIIYLPTYTASSPPACPSTFLPTLRPCPNTRADVHMGDERTRHRKKFHIDHHSFVGHCKPSASHGLSRSNVAHAFGESPRYPLILRLLSLTRSVDTLLIALCLASLSLRFSSWPCEPARATSERGALDRPLCTRCRAKGRCCS